MATPQSSLATERELRRLLADIRRIREWSSNLPDLSAYIANAMARSAIERELMDIDVILRDAEQRADALGRQIDPQPFPAGTACAFSSPTIARSPTTPPFGAS